METASKKLGPKLVFKSHSHRAYLMASARKDVDLRLEAWAQAQELKAAMGAIEAVDAQLEGIRKDMRGREQPTPPALTRAGLTLGLLAQMVGAVYLDLNEGLA